MPQSIEEQIGTLPAVKAETHLFEVSGEMFCGNPVPTEWGPPGRASRTTVTIK
jgi:hypothetical protein